MDGSAAQAIYRAEKARAQQERRMSHAQLMAEAKEAFNKMLADAQLARKGGRPRTNPVPPAAAPSVAVPNPVVAAAPAKPVRQVAKPKASSVKKAATSKKPQRVSSSRGALTRAKSKVAAKSSKRVAKKPSPSGRGTRTVRRTRQVAKKR
jgi:hypothetical protein